MCVLGAHRTWREVEPLLDSMIRRTKGRAESQPTIAHVATETGDFTSWEHWMIYRAMMIIVAIHNLRAYCQQAPRREQCTQPDSNTDTLVNVESVQTSSRCQHQSINVMSTLSAFTVQVPAMPSMILSTANRQHKPERTQQSSVSADVYTYLAV